MLVAGGKANRVWRFVAIHTSTKQGRVHLTVQVTLSRQMILGYRAVDLKGMALEMHLVV
jgi:hypothetical protein